MREIIAMFYELNSKEFSYELSHMGISHSKTRTCIVINYEGHRLVAFYSPAEKCIACDGELLARIPTATNTTTARRAVAS